MRWNLRMVAAERGIWKSTELRRQLAALREAAADGRRDEEWLRFQCEELTAANLRVDDTDFSKLGPLQEELTAVQEKISQVSQAWEDASLALEEF